MTSEIVHFEVVVTPEPNMKSIFSTETFPVPEDLDLYRPPPAKNAEVARRLQRNGMTVHHVGEFSISASCTSNRFESFFSTKISEIDVPEKDKVPSGYTMRGPKKGEKWTVPHQDGLDNLIEKAYIQHAPIFFGNERPIPPFWNDKFRLRVPGDVAQLMRADEAHRRNVTGRGVRVAMPDTGFYHHAYYRAQGYNFLAVASPDAIEPEVDTYGHGTGECANLLAVAPNANFVGVKMNNPVLGIKTAMDLSPDVMTCSWGYHLDGPLPGMPNWLRPLHLAVLSAVAKGTTVCFSAGNGHNGFPGSMPEVISVGGVNVTSDLRYTASDYASGFDSTWFPGRRTPDVCGLVGMRPKADYIVLPVQAEATLENAADPGAGWGAFSGTSAASPMVAGVCALLKEADPTLTPTQIKSILKHTARDITIGTNAHGKHAAPGPDGATGSGLADSLRALEVIL